MFESQISPTCRPYRIGLTEERSLNLKLLTFVKLHLTFQIKHIIPTEHLADIQKHDCPQSIPLHTHTHKLVKFTTDC